MESVIFDIGFSDSERLFHAYRLPQNTKEADSFHARPMLEVACTLGYSFCVRSLPFLRSLPSRNRTY
eukprot:m.111982 g.111982  ORF g.111982 m.111982 type:complete len:67 (-) comp51837_c0_seq14:64-264(-)